MAEPLTSLCDALRNAIAAAFEPRFAAVDPMLRRSQQERFGDYQANVAMSLAKTLSLPARDVATAIVAHLDLAGVCRKAEVAGPGFVNLTLEDSFLGAQITGRLADDRLGVPATDVPLTYVIDYSGPNVAKEMHVGHLRSTIIGDVIARVLEWLGHRVIRQNHIGDWGTQFGMLVEHLVDMGWAGEKAHHSIADLDDLYRAASAKFKADPSFAERARTRVLALQQGDGATHRLWEQLVEESKRHVMAVYLRLGVTLGEGDFRGESSYNDELADTVAELERRGLLRLDDGALCAFPAGFTGRDGHPFPLIVRKQDGGYNYESTDLAALRHRCRHLLADRILYVTDARQARHFAMIFAVAAEAGWLAEGSAAEHVPFGSILGSDGTPLKTRSGEPPRLVDLLDEAVTRARTVVDDKSPDLVPAERAEVAQAVGVGAVKYADLRNDRLRDYVFDPQRMLAMDGNTAPYLLYAHARIRSIQRKAGAPSASDARILPTHPAERALALDLLDFPAVVMVAAESLQPHRICSYLFGLASVFTSFYDACPVLRASSAEERGGRLALCDLTARTLRQGLSLLGIDSPDRM